jgi:ribonuclease P protein component
MAPASLSSSRDFRRVYRAGRKARADGITVWAAPPAGSGPGRLGIAIRAAAGTAVERNRARRRIKAIVRGLAPVDHDLIVGADRAAALASFQKLEQHLNAALTAATGGQPR